MDYRDKQLNRHMTERLAQAKTLPTEQQFRWAKKCVALAQRQHRTTFYLMARNWLASLQNTSATSDLPLAH
ncbi:hypothetical protein GCM10027217_23940 [Pseudomaricurvus hydrocarbonicus]